MKKIDTFYIVVTILIIIMMSLPIYFDCKTNSLFFAYSCMYYATIVLYVV